MDREIFRVELVTPCFLAGAKDETEWRSASIRGQLRWWFRAVGGAQWAGDLSRVRREEERLFGSTNRRSLLRVRILDGPKPSRSSFGTQYLAAQLAAIYGDPSAEGRLKIMGDRGEEGSNPLHYLAFGPVAKGRLERQYLPPASKAEFEIQWGPRSPKEGEEIRQVLAQALRAWMHLGGIGSKSRKGFGSLHCISGPSFKVPESRDELETQIKGLLALGSGFQKMAEWTHFSAGSRVFIGESTSKWDVALEKLGAWLIGFRRRYGYPGDPRSAGTVALKNRDYEWAAPRGRSPRQEIPDRAGFGLPLPFRRRIGTQVLGETVTWGARPKPGERAARDTDARRASPLLLHVSKLGESYLPVLTYLPARFLPKEGEFKFRYQPGLRPETPLLRSAVTRFLEDLQAKGLVREVRP